MHLVRRVLVTQLKETAEPKSRPDKKKGQQNAWSRQQIPVTDDVRDPNTVLARVQFAFISTAVENYSVQLGNI